ncbi:MAG: thiamine pyrophosphate-binding protein [Chloroflexi bacterium]|nr:thiamine pyrophosphate-binding protein [Chloroflexota bacterium]
MQNELHRAEFGSDVIVDLMKVFDIEYAAFNPGATFRGIHDSIVNYGGNRRPEVIECCHEEISVAIAHGYANATGKPMVAITHNIVGLQHASMAIFNAWCDRVPMIVMGGTGPMDTTRRRPWIDWIHTALVQGNLVRDFVKWDDQPYNVASVPESFIRAYRLAVTEPCGPVYLCYDADIQEGKLTEPLQIPDVTRFAPPAPLTPDPDALRRAAELLVKSRNPVIIADVVGRNHRAIAPLIELAETLVAPVIDRGGRFNFPTNHPLNMTGAEKQTLSEADIVLALDVRDLYGALGSVDKATRNFACSLQPDSKIIHITLSDLLVRSWVADYHKLQAVDIPIAADTAVAIPQLLSACVELGANPGKASERFERIKSRHLELRGKWRSQATAAANNQPIEASKLASDVWDAIKDEDWMLVNGNLNGWARRLWDLTRPDQYLSTSGGAGLGYGIGASLGAALAHRDSGKLCVDLQNDGDFLFCPSALWTAAHHRLPLLIVMNNNRTYYNSEEHQAEVARVRGRDVMMGATGTRITDPDVNYARLAESFGLYGEGPIERPEDIAPALKRAIQVVKERKTTALVDVVVRTR